MVQRRLGVVALAVAGLLAACGGGDDAEPGELLDDPQTLAVLTKAQLDASTAASGLQALTGLAKCDVRLVALNYATLGPKGEETNASGALLLPNGTGCEAPAPLVAYAKGTDVQKPRTLANPQDGETFLLMAVYAAQGYAVVATDYLGYGQSEFAYHPYLHADSEASSVIDSIRAARSAAAIAGSPLSGKVMLTGYSQGGHSSMAAHREIEKNLRSEINVVAGAHLAGPYNLSGSFKLTEAIAGYQFFVPFLVTSWQKVYGDVYTDKDAVFKAPYAANIENLLPSPTLNYTTLVTSGSLPGAMGETPNEARDALFQPDFVADVQSNDANSLYLTAKKNDLLDWTPLSLTMLCSGKEDPTVPPALHQDVLKAIFDGKGLTNVLSVDVDPLIRATYGAVLASSPATYYGSYHGTYAPPFCHANAKGLFDTVK